MPPRPLPRLIAHRGGGALHPENTLAAFEAAVSLWWADLIETDLQVTADGVPVVFHDDTLERCTDGSGPVAIRTWEGLSSLDAGHRFSLDGGRTFPWRGRGLTIPRLDQVLAAFPRTGFSLDLKPHRPELAERLAEVLRATGASDRVVVGSEHDDVAARLAEALPRARRFFPLQAAVAFVMAVRSGSPPDPDPRWQVLALPLDWQGTRVIDRALVDAARAQGREVWAWTVDSPDEQAELVALGVDGIVTDRPDRLREVFDRAGG